MKMKSSGKEKKKNIYDKRNAFYRKRKRYLFFLLRFEFKNYES